tara:strand:- start:24 stop:326 length:303 start_codon:yes stop_codon:yes gene_type:complete
MSKAFGTKFIILNDTQQILNSRVFGGGPWLHIATVVRGLKEYMCFKHTPTDKVYIEEIDGKSPNLFKQISSQSEFDDIKNFLLEKGLLTFGIDKEFKVAK